MARSRSLVRNGVSQPIMVGRVGYFSGFAVVSPERMRENEELRNEIALFILSFLFPTAHLPQSLEGETG